MANFIANIINIQPKWKKADKLQAQPTYPIFLIGLLKTA